MISARNKEITLFSHPALWNAGIEWRKRAPYLRSRFQERLQSWTKEEQEATRQELIFQALRIHRQRGKMGSPTNG